MRMEEGWVWNGMERGKENPKWKNWFSDNLKKKSNNG